MPTDNNTYEYDEYYQGAYTGPQIDEAIRRVFTGQVGGPPGAPGANGIDGKEALMCSITGATSAPVVGESLAAENFNREPELGETGQGTVMGTDIAYWITYTVSNSSANTLIVTSATDIRGQDGTVSFEDLTEEQIEMLRGPEGPEGPPGPQGQPGIQGPPGEGISQSEADARYLQLTGGTITGSLAATGTVSSNGKMLTTVDDVQEMIDNSTPSSSGITQSEADNRYLKLTGGNISGTLSVGNKAVATQEYVDNTLGNMQDGLPTGGTTGQVLTKNSNNNYDVKWANTNSGGVGQAGSGTHAEIFNNYTNNKASGYYAHAEGFYTYAERDSSHVEGNCNVGLSAYSHVEGTTCVTTPYPLNVVLPIRNSYPSTNTIFAYTDTALFPVQDTYDELQIGETVLLVSGSSIYETTVTAKTSTYNSYTITCNNVPNVSGGFKWLVRSSKYYDYSSGWGGHAEGSECVAMGAGAHAEGEGCAATRAAHAEGLGCYADGLGSHASGVSTKALVSAQTAIGYNNIASTNSTDRFIIGKGETTQNGANCFRVTDTGTYASGNYNASGADYAEMFEWADGNPKKQDRCGLFVTLSGEKIRLATPKDDFILGIVSGNPSVVGDSVEDQWDKMYLTDIFGRPIMETVEVPAETIEEPDPEDSSKTITRVIREAHTETRQKLNPDYDPKQKYIGRKNRPEWDAVGMLGKLVMVDDGTCQVDGYATTGKGGKATHSAEYTPYRVMARLDETHIKVLVLG